MAYSIIIPVYNELPTLKRLLKGLEQYYNDKHEILIIDDGSNDGSTKILENCSYIKLIKFKFNLGKGVAIKKGIYKSKNSKILIFDGDLELKTNDISKLIELSRSKMGIRYKYFSPLKSGIDWGNFIFTTFFNLFYISMHKDILCCAKSFYKKDIPLTKIRSTGFDIDVELSSILTKINNKKPILQVLLNYKRRTIQEGKKLEISDGWKILKRIFLSR